MAGKRRKPSKYNVPYVHITRGRIEYRPRIRVADRNLGLSLDKNGFLKPPIKLGMDGDDPDTIYRAYLAAKDQIKKQTAYQKCSTLGWLWQQYSQSRQFTDLVPASQKRNQNLIKILEHPIDIEGRATTLANLHIESINKPLFQTLAEKRLSNYQEKGKKGQVQVNREITLVSTMLSWGTNYLQEFAELGIHQNPLRGIKKLNEPKNTRYVTDKEYLTQFKLAEQIADYLQPIMAITYLTASRGIEVLDIKLSDCTEQGIKTSRRKGSKDNIILWSESLKIAYQQALELHKKRPSSLADPYLIAGFSGGKLSKSTLDDGFQRLKKLMEAKGIEGYWSLHLLKAKGVSDSEDKHIAGHVTETMRQRYDVKIPVKNPVK